MMPISSVESGRAHQAASSIALETASPFAEQACLVAEELDAAVQRFSQFLQFRTVSSPLVPHHTVEPDEFRRLHEWMPTAFPEVWETLEVEEVGDGNLSYLLKWTGTAEVKQQRRQQHRQQQQQQQPVLTEEEEELDAAGQPLLPVLFLSHLDVVPVANETLANWTHPPFSGAVAGGYVWGRGALDDKVGVAGLLEAATLLIRTGWRPLRTLYFAFGQDEEVGGGMGAAQIAALLASRGVKVDMVFDEGGSIGADGYPPYSTRPVALVGLAEKGYATILVQVSAAGGHSSIPPLDGSSAAAVAARIVTAINRRPPPARLVAPVTQFLSAIAPSTPGLRGQLFSVAASPLAPDWLRDLVAGAFLGRDTPETAALIRDTAAVTGLTLGFADNVLPPSATVRVNFRLLPGSTVQDVIDYLTEVAGPDLPHVRFEMNGSQNGSQATPVTPASSPYFAQLKAAVQQVYLLKDGSGSVDVAPTLMAGGTDSKHYLRISAGGALRHVPVSLNKTAGDVRRVHGLNERVSVADFGRGVCVFQRLLQLVGGGGSRSA
ncbi:hypothetical protein HYH02_008803 [Chlamydomonas schloesseri]|uniref:Peptidase M20 dimerisation domain-containing protein n=1 Tax=Chlamydomonas schloesseri TaxID=2026947 RepID=A0A835WDE5_9CHLO|nr:hypothetical protein HYH02_008803 [Chlamydomonas schloesseri]|eukprot:KAG2445338.1 hypothetical protein HYH02_008803 [Chlamydomonas schloesseri]